MNPNSYRLQKEDEVDAADIAALLEELKDVGGSLEESKSGAAVNRPLSGKTVRRGIVGGTNVLTEQQRSGTTAPSLNLHRRSNVGFGNSGIGDNRGDNNSTDTSRGLDGAGRRKASAGAAAGSLSPLGFSTYDTTDAVLMETQLQQTLQPQLPATPLGVRLTPLLRHHSSTGGENPAARANGVHPPSPPKRPHVPPPLPESPTSTRTAGTSGGGSHRPSLNSQSALPPLPGLPKRKSFTTSNVHKDSDVGHGSGTLHLQPASGAAFLDNKSGVFSGAGASERPGQESGSSSNSAAAPCEINFLPIMCARYLRPVGLNPTARWGHSLTPINPDLMLLFGGLDVRGADTASLMSFNPTTISWEPLYSMGDGPEARHSHAACSYDGRYLIISGGVALHGGRVLDDLYLYDTYSHHWRCVWSGEWDGSPQNRNEPGPRFGHSIVLHEDRLFLFGGKTVSAADAAGGKHRGSTAHTSPLKTAATTDISNSGSVAATTAAATLASGNDIYVFSLNSFRWRRRLRCAKGRSGLSSATTAGVYDKNGTTSADLNVSGGEPDDSPELSARPSARAHHAACVRGTTMFINGGAGAVGVLTDTWAVELTTGVWRCIHRGGTADAVPREKHALFVCGEALLLVGGCSGAGGLNERITGKFTNFAVVLPLIGVAVEAPCWIPVAMGNLSIVSPGKKSFSAALSGGFVYVFGGVCGAEPATNTMIRFLAADGCVSQNDQLGGAAATGPQQLRLMLQQLRDQQRGAPYDTYAYAGTYGSVADVAWAAAQLPTPWAGVPLEDGQAPPAYHPTIDNNSKNNNSSTAADDATVMSDVAVVGLHRVIVQQRAPLFLQELEKCRSELYRVGGGGGVGLGAGSVHSTPQKRKGSVRAGSATNNSNNDVGDASGDEVDALLREFGGVGCVPSRSSKEKSTPQNGEDRTNHNRNDASNVNATASTAEGSSAGADGLPVYYTNGTTRVPGLAQPLTADALQCLTDYIYWGGLKGKYRILLEEKGEADTAATDGNDSGGNNGSVDRGSSFSTEYRNQLMQTLQIVKAAAEAYKLDPLQELCASLLSGNREAMELARQRASEQLCADFVNLLNAPVSANTTMLVVDPHTKAKAVHVLHSSVLMAASGLFTELLRPLYRASARLGSSKAANQVGPLAAKLSATAAQSPTVLLTSTSKRTILIGPVPLPLPAVKPILRYLYTQELQVSGELAFEVMLGAHQLGLTELQALCEAVVAREEVNYQTCCTFYYLSRKYQASLLEEIALLTAVSGFAEVRYTAAYQSLSDEEKQNIDAVATELGSSVWVPPPQPTQEMKPTAAYAARWESSAPM